jgi:hypothetical protein
MDVFDFRTITNHESESIAHEREIMKTTVILPHNEFTVAYSQETLREILICCGYEEFNGKNGDSITFQEMPHGTFISTGLPEVSFYAEDVIHDQIVGMIEDYEATAASIKADEQAEFDEWLAQENAPHGECCDEVEQVCYRPELPMPMTDETRRVIAEQEAKEARLRDVAIKPKQMLFYTLIK